MAEQRRHAGQSNANKRTENETVRARTRTSSGSSSWNRHGECTGRLQFRLSQELGYMRSALSSGPDVRQSLY
jgi:hypothetical protein